jgi:hypothetical protein
VVRWLLAALILGYSAWKLAGAWTALEPTALVWRPIPLLAGSLVGGAALVTLAVVAGVGLRAAQLPVGGARPGFWLGWMRVWFQGYFYRYVPGKLMLVVERARLGERLGIPKAASVMLVVWESLLLLAGAGLFGGVGLLALPGGDGPLSGALVAALALASLVGSLLLWPIVGALARRAPRLAARLPGSVLTVPSAAQVDEANRQSRRRVRMVRGYSKRNRYSSVPPSGRPISLGSVSAKGIGGAEQRGEAEHNAGVGLF